MNRPLNSSPTLQPNFALQRSRNAKAEITFISKNSGASRDFTAALVVNRREVYNFAALDQSVETNSHLLRKLLEVACFAGSARFEHHIS